MGQGTVPCPILPCHNTLFFIIWRDVGIEPYARKLYAALRVGHDPPDRSGDTLQDKKTFPLSTVKEYFLWLCLG